MQRPEQNRVHYDTRSDTLDAKVDNLTKDLTALCKTLDQTLQLARQRITQLESDNANQGILLQARNGEIARLVASPNGKDKTIGTLELQSQQKVNEISSLRTSHDKDVSISTQRAVRARDQVHSQQIRFLQDCVLTTARETVHT